MTALTVLVGGARSGKSALAVRWATAHRGPVAYLATAEALDDDMAARIERHRAERPRDWLTVEEPLDLIGACAALPSDAFVIVDCLTLWVTNLLTAGLADDEIESRSAATARELAGRRGPVVAISNEVGLGIVPDSELGRRYRDLLGRVNQAWVGASSRAWLLVAGRAIELVEPHSPPAASTGGHRDGRR